MSDFKFNNYGKFTDGEIEVVVREKRPAAKLKGYVPSYEFNILLPEKHDPIGRIGLRIGNTKLIIMYVGHIGFEIQEEYRGHRYAMKACNIIKRVAIDHCLKTLWINCSSENYPARRTCELLGCEFVEIVDLPEYTVMYQRGDRQACRYRWDLATS